MLLPQMSTQEAGIAKIVAGAHLIPMNRWSDDDAVALLLSLLHLPRNDTLPLLLRLVVASPAAIVKLSNMIFHFAIDIAIVEICHILRKMLQTLINNYNNKRFKNKITPCKQHTEKTTQ